MSKKKNFQLLRRKVRADPQRARQVAEHKRAIIDAIALAETREQRNVTQKEIAAKLGVSQANVSRIEREHDIYLSTLGKYIEALGGHLEINAVFPDDIVRPIRLRVRETVAQLYSVLHLPYDAHARLDERVAKTQNEVRARLNVTRAERVVEILDLVVRNLGSAEVGQVLILRVNLDDTDELTSLLGGDPDTLEHASMSLAVEDTKTALDLCAAAVQAAYSTVPLARNAYLADLEHPKGLRGPLAIWHKTLKSSTTYRDILSRWRNVLVHRDIHMEWRDSGQGPRLPGDWTYRRRGVAAIDAHPSGHGLYKIMMPDDVLGIVEFGFEQVDLFCDALEATLPTS